VTGTTKNIRRAKRILNFFLFVLSFSALSANVAIPQTPPSESQSAGDLGQAITYIKEFDEQNDTTYINKALQILESYLEYTPVELYWKSEAWVKYYLFKLESSPKDPGLSEHIRSHLLELWVSLTELEEQIDPVTLTDPTSEAF